MTPIQLAITRRQLLTPMGAALGFRTVTIAFIVYFSTISILFADVLPQPEPAFRGTIGLSAKDSTADWPQPVKAPKEAPNVVLILLDDVGFGDASTFGGVAQTPELDRLAARGLRYSNFHTTSMCSPTRAALLTGRNHHRVGFGRIADIPDGFPGYDSLWKKNAASIAAVLRGNGYSTAAFGKWHNTPSWEISPVGPFDRWPTGLGFERFYGFMAGQDNHWEPSALYRDTTAIEAPAKPDEGYHLTTNITDEAIRWVQTQESLAPEKPYFLYCATGATHAPHHVPEEWIDRYRGQFDQGWDKLREEIFARQKKLGVVPDNTKLTPRPRGLPAWSSLSADHKRLYARQMEVYAGFLAHTDHEVGRLLKTVQEGPRGDNTLILYIVGDNGPSGMGGLEGADSDLPISARLQQRDKLGGPLHKSTYATGWAWAGSTPFQGLKGIASHFGGLRDPLIVSWPARIKHPGGLRTQFTHVNDVAATLYEAAKISFPDAVDGVKQIPLDGTSFVSSFDDPKAASGHRIQYFEMWGNRAVYEDGWVAAARHDLAWNAGGRSDVRTSVHTEVSKDRWELYDVTQDFSQAHDLATRYPKKLRELQSLFDAEARRNNVYPLTTGSDLEKIFENTPSITKGKREFVYHAGIPRVPPYSAPVLARSSSYRITANLQIPDNGAQGVVLEWGDRSKGIALYVREGRLVFENNSGRTREVMTSNISLPRGPTTVAYEFVPETTQKKGWKSRSGRGRLYVNGQPVGEAKVTQSAFFHGAMGIGRMLGSPVIAFENPPPFTGVIDKVSVNLQ